MSQNKNMATQKKVEVTAFTGKDFFINLMTFYVVFILSLPFLGVSAGLAVHLFRILA